jgi:hypothetical protein
MHYMEDEMRKFKGQGWGTQGWTTTKRVLDIRKTMEQVTNTLENERRKWETDITKAEAKKESQNVEDKATEDRLKMIRGAQRIATDASSAAAQESFTSGASLLRVTAPDDFAVKARAEAKPKAKPQKEAAVEYETDGAAQPQEIATGQENEAAAEQAEEVAESNEAVAGLEEEALAEEPNEEGPAESVNGLIVGDDEEKRKDLRVKLERFSYYIMNDADEELEYYISLYRYLPEDEQIDIEHIANCGVGFCSKCRWSHGCLECDGIKALKYHIGTSQMVPKRRNGKVIEIPSE